MSDRRLRELERWHAQGDPGAEAPLLLERLRVGQLPNERLELAAYLGHAPALVALDDDTPVIPRSLESWVRGLRPWGQAVWVRAAVAAARLALRTWTHGDERPGEAVSAAERWATTPSPENAEAARTAALDAYEVLEEIVRDKLADQEASARLASWGLVFRESRAAVQAALTACEDEGRAMTHAVLAAVAAKERVALDGAPTALHVRAGCVGRLGEMPELDTGEAIDQVMRVIREAIVPWALDPERVVTRAW